MGIRYFGLGVVLALGICAGGAQLLGWHKKAADRQTAKSWSDVFHNDRLKRIELQTLPVAGDNDVRIAAGLWVPESGDSAKAMVFPEQVKITCTRSDRNCREISITIAANPGMVTVLDIGEKDWPVSSWDAQGLLASYEPDPNARSLADKCHSHVLSMTFSSGAITTSDIPTHEKGCEAFAESDSYRLVQGNYYVDTTPGNDMDKLHQGK